MSDLAGLEEIEEQTRASVNHRTSNRGRNNWGLPPNIERARAAREPKKPPPPAAAIKPAPEVVTLASLPPGTIFRLVADLEGLKEAFSDRVAELDVPMTQIDFAGEMTFGQTQKLLIKSNSKWSRTFGWKSLGKILKGTGLTLALIVDDARFEPLRAQMTKRKCHHPHRPPAENAGD